MLNQKFDWKEKINKFLFVRILLLSLGLIAMALGTVLMYRSSLGTGPITTISDGISKVFSLSYGDANTVTNTLFLVIAIILNRKNIGLGTIITVFTLGFYINFWEWILPEINYDISFISKIIISLIGTIVSAMGLAFYIQLELGMGPMECLVEYLYKNTKMQYKTARTLFDGTLLTLGLLMGGTYGLGTALNVFLTGKLMQYFIDLNEKYLGGVYEVIIDQPTSY